MARFWNNFVAVVMIAVVIVTQFQVASIDFEAGRNFAPEWLHFLMTACTVALTAMMIWRGRWKS